MANIETVKSLEDVIVDRLKEEIQKRGGQLYNAEIEDMSVDDFVTESEKLINYKKQITEEQYEIKGMIKTKDGAILVGTKDGENTKLYSFKNGKLEGSVIIDIKGEAESTEYDEKTGNITMKTKDGKTHIYTADRINASIKIAQKYEGTNSGKYYSTNGEKVVEVAESTLGKDYVYGASGPDAYDCSGLVGYCLTGSHERIGTTYTFMEWPETSNPEPGDICVNESHTGIYIGNGQMIHAATEGVGVITGPVQSGMKYVKYPGD